MTTDKMSPIREKQNFSTGDFEYNSKEMHEASDYESPLALVVRSRLYLEVRNIRNEPTRA
jgi:hypothetical protein